MRNIQISLVFILLSSNLLLCQYNPDNHVVTFSKYYLKYLKDVENGSSEERKKRFQAMSSYQRKALLRKKMKAQGLVEGSGIKPLSSYDTDEVWDLIQITSCFPEMQAKPKAIKRKTPNKKKSLIT